MQFRFRTVRVGMEEWHFSERCQGWPAEDFIEKLDAPPVSQLCEKCIELSAARFLDSTPRPAPRT